MGTKQKYKLNHEENRSKVCAGCGEKIKFGKSKPCKFLITPRIEQLLKTFSNPKFNLNNLKFPTSICGTCRKILCEYEKNIKTRLLLPMPNFEKQKIVTQSTRNTEFGVCHCYICEKAGYTGHKKIVKGRGKTRSLEKNSEGQANEKKVILCKACFSEVRRGKKHLCTISETKDNVVGIFRNIQPKNQEQVLSSVLKSQEDVEKKSHNNGLITLSTKGRPLRLATNPKKDKKVTFSHDSLDRFQASMGASNNAMKKLANFLRTSAGRKTVSVDYKTHLSENIKILDDLYEQDSFCLISKVSFFFVIRFT